jgi:branched-chain amino acid transport system substrate-binding protein
MPHPDNDRSHGVLTRRAFLRVAAAAGAAAGSAAGLGSLLGACGSDAATATTAGPASTTGGASASTTTSAGAGVEQAGEFKAGYVLPVTGKMAEFGAAAAWQIDWFAKNVWKDGLVMGDGKRHEVTVILKDMESHSNRASIVAEDLIVNEDVMLVGACAGAANVLPVREVAEDFGCPCITYDCPGDAWNEGQPEGGFKWCWHSWFLLRDMAANFTALWNALPTNKTVSALYPNDGDGVVFAGALPPIFKSKGFNYVDAGRFENGVTDFAGMIGQMRQAGVEILTGVPASADFAVFWTQAAEQGFRPKISTQAKALLLPSGVEVLGESGDGQTMECWFHPAFPYTGSVTGATARQLCDSWEEDTGEQWVQTLCYHSQFEVWTDVMSRCADPSSKSAIALAIKQTKITTVGGPVDWTVNPEPYSGFYNFSTKPVAAGQWVKGSDAWKYDMQIVTGATLAGIEPTAAVKELP